MKSEIDLVLSKIKSRLVYHSETGEFSWKRVPGNSRTINSWNSRYSGKIAGTKRCVNKESKLYYVFINIEGMIYRAHALVWLFEKGELVKGIDHIDGDGLNNHISNLRVVPHSINQRKARIPVNNTSGFKGVSYRKDTCKWTARAKIQGRYKSLGSFTTKEEAFDAYKNAVLEECGEIHVHLITK